MVRRAIIEVILVPESSKVKPKMIKLDILKAVYDGELIIPWCCKVEKVKVGLREKFHATRPSL